MNNYFIIHGTYGSNEGNWFPWLKEQLENKRLDCIVPQFPIGEGQNYDNWSNVLDLYSNKINENTIFICHSIAPIFIIKYLLDRKIKVYGLILVSGFNNYSVNEEYDTLNKTFFIDENNIFDIYKYCRFIYCLYGDNDPYIKLEELERFASNLKAERYLIKNGGHLNSESGYTKFDTILKVIKDISNNLDLSENDDMPIGINFIILSNENQILLGRRINNFGHGTYSLIGAKLKTNETIEECVRREIKEEIDLDVSDQDIEIVNIAETITTRHMIQIGVKINKYIGIPKIMEPHKCDDLKFFFLDELPELFVGTKPNIELFIKNKLYDKKNNIIQ